jgi:hypothetical protein
MQTALLGTLKWATRVELSTAIFDWVETPHQPFVSNGSLIECVKRPGSRDCWGYWVTASTAAVV